MKPTKEEKCEFLRRLFLYFDRDAPITYTDFGTILGERPDLVGKYLSGDREIPYPKFVEWQSRFVNDNTTFDELPPAACWPPKKKSYRMMEYDERLSTAAETVSEYNSRTHKLGKIIPFLVLLKDEILMLVPEEIIAKSKYLRLFLECFD